MKRFIQGGFHLQDDVNDIQRYEQEHNDALQKIVAWANDLNVAVRFGTTAKNEYVAEYEARAKTSRMCKGIVSELKAMLNEHWNGVRMTWQMAGDIMD